MYKVLVILPHELAAGFALSGVAVQRVGNVDEAQSALSAAMDSGEYGIVVVDENMLEQMDERAVNRFFRQNIPLVVPLPGDLQWGDTEETQQDDYVARLIRRAVGYQLNIQL